jgi:hypothetical protein
VVVTGLSSGVASISAGFDNACAVTTSGAAYCWGDNSNGQLGNGSTTNSLVPVAVTGLSSGVASISAGNGLTCAVTTSGAAYCWGWNGEGDLGIGSTTGSLVPVAVTGLSSGVASISAGFLHTCAVTTSGAIYCWGHNSNGELGNGSTTKSMVPVLSTDLLGESFTSPVKADWVGNFKQPVASYVGVTSCKTIPGGREVTYRFNLTGGSFVTPDGTGFKAVGEGETYAYDDQVSEFYSSENLATSDVYNAYIGFEINRLPSNVSELKSYFGKWDKTRPMSYFTPVAVQTKDLCQIGVGTQSSGHDHFQLIYLSGTSSGADLSQAIQHEAMVVDKWFADQLSGRSPNYGGSIPPVISIHNDSDLSAALNGNEGAVIDSWRKSGLLGPTAEPVIYADGYAPRSDRACGWSTYGVGIMIPMVNCNRYPKPASVWLDGATYLLAHETTHSLGFTDHVQDDSRDVLYNGPVSGWGGQILLDPNHHHYLNTGDETSLEILDSPLLSGVYGK